MRLRLDLSYDGSTFHGWATQPGLRTVAGVLSGWITRVLRLAQPAVLVVAGRTDAGVHARGQVCHVDVPGDEDPSQDLLRRLRRVLPHDIVVRAAAAAPEGFDARFSAIWRRYCYRLADADTVPDPLLRGHVATTRHALDVDTLATAAHSLTGLRDFAAFCKPREGATTIRDLRSVCAHRRNDGVVEIEFVADAFCHSMVRSLAGALSAVAGRQRDLAWLETVAASTRRHGEIPVMPALGLTLEEIGYPPPGQLAARAQQARALRSLS